MGNKSHSPTPPGVVAFLVLSAVACLARSAVLRFVNDANYKNAIGYLMQI